jgi:hypothetical protein
MTMGMKFNTPHTKEINDSANLAFNSAGLATLRGDPRWATTFAALPAASTLNPTGGTFDLCTVHLPNKIRPTGSMTSWAQWLGFLDTQPNARSTIPNEVVATTVGKAISDALNNVQHNFTQVEIFIVPDNGNQISASVVDFVDKHGEWSKVITIFTNTFDQLGQHHARHRRER